NMALVHCAEDRQDYVRLRHHSDWSEWQKRSERPGFRRHLSTLTEVNFKWFRSYFSGIHYNGMNYFYDLERGTKNLFDVNYLHHDALFYKLKSAVNENHVKIL